LQNSLIAANKPLFISHYSKNKEWAFVFSSFTSGWIRVRDIVVLDEKEADIWQNAQGVFIYNDTMTVQKDGMYLFHLRIGMYLPLVQENETTYTLLAATRLQKESRFFTIEIPKEYASTSPLLFTKENIQKVLSQLHNQPYGWGGMYNLRDCSATMRDFFAPFGIWLPRNSYVQSKVGKIYSLQGLSAQEKKEQILKNAKAFKTLIYRRGHIALYVGEYKGEIVIFQNLWGVRTKNKNKTGRVVVGKAVFSTLELGKEAPYCDTQSCFLQKVQSFNVLVE